MSYRVFCGIKTGFANFLNYQERLCTHVYEIALSAILKWAHLHNKQSCEKDLAAVHWLSDLVLISIRLNLDFEDFQLIFLSIIFQTNEGAVFLSENPMFEICSNGFSHFKLSQNGCKSSSLVNEHENVKIEFQIPVGRVSFFFRKIENIKSLKIFFGYG